jgi:hypothetical protein
MQAPAYRQKTGRASSSSTASTGLAHQDHFQSATSTTPAAITNSASDGAPLSTMAMTKPATASSFDYVLMNIIEIMRTCLLCEGSVMS